MSVTTASQQDPKTINLMIRGGVFDSQAAYLGWQFCRTALAADQRIKQVFFYQQGVTQASALVAPLADEFDAVSAWRELAAEHDIELVVCISAAEKRGILGDEQRAELAKPASNLASGFQIAGLGSFFAASRASDHTVTF